MDSKVTLNLIKHWQSVCCDIVFADIAPVLLQHRIISVEEYQLIVSQPEGMKVESLLTFLIKKDETLLLKFVECLEEDYGWIAEKLREDYEPEFSLDDSRDEIDASPVITMDVDNEEENVMSDRGEDEINGDDGVNGDDGMNGDDGKCNCGDDDNCEDDLDSLNRNNKMNNSIYNKYKGLKSRNLIKTKVKNRLIQRQEHFHSVSSTTELLKPGLNEEITDKVITIVRRTPSLSGKWTTIAHSLGLTDRIDDIRFTVGVYGEDISMCVAYLLKDWVEMYPKKAKLSKLIEVLRSERFNALADKLTKILLGRPKKCSA